MSTPVYYSVYNLRFEGLDGKKDLFTEIRRNYFEKGLSAKGSDSYEESGQRVKVKYDISPGAPMVWKKKLGFTTVEASEPTPSGYVITKISPQKLLVKRTHYTNDHRWEKSEFFSKTMQKQPKVIVSVAEEGNRLLVQEFDPNTAAYVTSKAVDCDFSGNTIVEKKLNVLTGFIPEIVAVTADGRSCYLPPEQAQKRRDCLNRLISSAADGETPEPEAAAKPVTGYEPLPSLPEPEQKSEPDETATIAPPVILPPVSVNEPDPVSDEFPDVPDWESAEFDYEKKLDLEDVFKEHIEKMDDLSMNLFNQYGFEAPAVTEDYYHEDEPELETEFEAPGKVRVAVQRINKKADAEAEAEAIVGELAEEFTEQPPESECPYTEGEQTEIHPEPEEVDYLERLLDTLAGDTLITEPETAAQVPEPGPEPNTGPEPNPEPEVAALPQKPLQEEYDAEEPQPEMIEETPAESDPQSQSGFGTGRTAQNTFFTGNWIDGKREGIGSEFDQNGVLIYSGSWKNDARDGDGIEFGGDSGIVYFGSWKNGRYSGMGKALQPDGGYIEGEFADGKPSGIATEYAPDGFKLFEGHWFNGMYNGFGKRYLRAGGWFEGVFAAGRPSGTLNGYNCFPTDLAISFPEKTGNVLSEGTPTITIPDIPAGESRLIYTGEWADDQFSGIGILFSETGAKIYEGSFRNNSFEGSGALFSENGEYIYCGQFVGGRRSGIGSGYRAGKVKYHGQWQDDYRHGSGVEYADGEPAYVGFFELNLKHGRINIISDNNVKYECIYDHGVLSYIRCYEEGRKIFYEGSVKNAIPCGMGCLINDYGEKLQEGVFDGKVLEKAMPVNLRELPKLPYIEELVNSDYEKFRVWGNFVMDIPFRGGRYSGCIADGLPNGKGTILYADHRFTGGFAAGHPSGAGILYTNSGLRYTGEFLPVFKPNSKVLTFKDGQVYYYYPSDDIPFSDPEGILTDETDFSDMDGLVKGEDGAFPRLQIKRRHTAQLEENLRFEEPGEIQE